MFNQKKVRELSLEVQSLKADIGLLNQRLEWQKSINCFLENQFENLKSKLPARNSKGQYTSKKVKHNV